MSLYQFTYFRLFPPIHLAFVIPLGLGCLLSLLLFCKTFYLVSQDRIHETARAGKQEIFKRDWLWFILLVPLLFLLFYDQIWINEKIKLIVIVWKKRELKEHCCKLDGPIIESRSSVVWYKMSNIFLIRLLLMTVGVSTFRFSHDRHMMHLQFLWIECLRFFKSGCQVKIIKFKLNTYLLHKAWVLFLKYPPSA